MPMAASSVRTLKPTSKEVNTALTARAPPIAFAPSSPISFSPRTKVFQHPAEKQKKKTVVE